MRLSTNLSDLIEKPDPYAGIGQNMDTSIVRAPLAPLATSNAPTVQGGASELARLEGERSRLTDEAYGGKPPKRKKNFSGGEFIGILLATALAKLAGVKDQDTAMGLRGLMQGRQGLRDDEYENDRQEDLARRQRALSQAGLTGDKIEQTRRGIEKSEARDQELLDRATEQVANERKTKEAQDFMLTRDKALLEGKQETQEQKLAKTSMEAWAKGRRGVADKLADNKAQAEAYALIDRKAAGDPGWTYGDDQRLQEILAQDTIDDLNKKSQIDQRTANTKLSTQKWEHLKKLNPLKLKEVAANVDKIIANTRLTDVQRQRATAMAQGVGPEYALKVAGLASRYVTGEASKSDLESLIRIEKERFKELTATVNGQSAFDQDQNEARTELEEVKANIDEYTAQLRLLLKNKAKGTTSGGGAARRGGMTGSAGDLGSGKGYAPAGGDLVAPDKNVVGEAKRGSNMSNVGAAVGRTTGTKAKTQKIPESRSKRWEE